MAEVNVISNPDGEKFPGNCNKQDCVFILTNETLKFLDKTVQLSELSNLTREEERLGDNTERIIYKPEVDGEEKDWTWEIYDQERQEDFEEFVVTLINSYQDLEDESEGEEEESSEIEEEPKIEEEKKKQEEEDLVADDSEKKRLAEEMIKKEVEAAAELIMRESGEMSEEEKKEKEKEEMVRQEQEFLKKTKEESIDEKIEMPENPPDETPDGKEDGLDLQGEIEKMMMEQPSENVEENVGEKDEEERKREEEEKRKSRIEDEKRVAEEKARKEEEERKEKEEKDDEERKRIEEENLQEDERKRKEEEIQKHREEQLRQEALRDEQRRNEKEEEEYRQKEQELEERRLRDEDEKIRALEEAREMIRVELELKRSQVTKVETDVQLQKSVKSLFEKRSPGTYIKAYPFEIELSEMSALEAMEKVVSDVMECKFRNEVIGESGKSSDGRWILFPIKDELQDIKLSSRDDWVDFYFGVHINKKNGFQKMTASLLSKKEEIKSESSAGVIVSELSSEAILTPLLTTAFTSEVKNDRYYVQIALHLKIAPNVGTDVEHRKMYRITDESTRVIDLENASEMEFDSCVCVSNICVRISKVDPDDQSGFGLFPKTLDRISSFTKDEVKVVNHETEFANNLRGLMSSDGGEVELKNLIEHSEMLDSRQINKYFLNIWQALERLREDSDVLGGKLMLVMLPKPGFVQRVVGERYSLSTITYLLSCVEHGGEEGLNLAEVLAMEIVGKTQLYEDENVMRFSFDVNELYKIILEEYEYVNLSSQKKLLLRMFNSLMKMYPVPLKRVAPFFSFLQSALEGEKDQNVLKGIVPCFSTIGSFLEKAGGSLFLYFASFPKETVQILNDVLLE